MVRAAETFLLTDPETFSYLVVGVGEDIPEWALDKGLVTHPDILEGDLPDVDDADTNVNDDGGEDESGEDQTEEDDVSRETETSEEDTDSEEYAGLDDLVAEDDEDDQPRPSGDWKKADILNYAMTNGYDVTGSETKDQLLELINEG